MSPAEARRIVEALANGVDPDGGELLPPQAVFNQPGVIRALFLAARALQLVENREQARRALPDHGGHPWSELEDNQLLQAFDAGLPLKQIAADHGRSRSAISARLVRLGRLSEPSALEAVGDAKVNSLD
ncbi:hypothetical protein [Chromobacterium sphagni]|uniref:hypothetical protein n=1 Tax=Chromobacterium sphagni TaxID=1903179 RepID=UPI0011143160|nr:hypothetical protein [Chromobacterium sphagni]